MSTPILKSLEADPSNRLDLSKHRPDGLNRAALRVWKHLEQNTPYWWSRSDLLTVERYCFLVGTTRTLQDRANQLLGDSGFPDDEEWASYKQAIQAVKALSIELKSIEYSLGVTPQGRAALKLSWPDDPSVEADSDDSSAPMDPSLL